MRRTAVTTALLCALGLVSTAPPVAQAAILDTYDFSVTGWSQFPSGGSEPQTLTGSFTGFVEPSGFIEQGDLNSFSATFGSLSFGLADLNLFSFDTNGSGSTLDIQDGGGLTFTVALCVGAAASLHPNCTANGTASLPTGITASLVGEVLPFAVSSTQPTVTLQSSIVSTTPVPAGLPLFATGLAGLGLYGWRKKRRAQADAV